MESEYSNSDNVDIKYDIKYESDFIYESDSEIQNFYY